MIISIAAKKTKILPVHIFSLIRFKIIKSCYVNNEISISFEELQNWIEENKELSEKLKIHQSSTYSLNPMYEYLVKIGKIEAIKKRKRKK